MRVTSQDCDSEDPLAPAQVAEPQGAPEEETHGKERESLVPRWFPTAMAPISCPASRWDCDPGTGPDPL